jgi:gliding motility-associated GldN-like protein
MDIPKMAPRSFALLALLIGSSFIPRDNNNDAVFKVWTKVVTREVEIGREAAPAVHKTKGTREVALIEQLISAVKEGKLAAWSNVDITFTEKLRMPDLDEMTTSKHDTFMITDPVTGKEHRKVIAREFKPEAIRKYRILENWAYNPYEGKTEVQILGIAPVRKVFASDGSFRGVQAMFWLRYADVEPFLDQYEHSSAANTLTGAIWSDYVSGANTADFSNATWKCKANRIIDMNAKQDTATHHLLDVSPTADTTLMELLDKAIKAGNINVYKNTDPGLTDKLPYERLSELTNFRVDTQVITDPVTGRELKKYITDHRTIYYKVPLYKIAEEWTFNRITGKIDIQITAVAPTFEPDDMDGKSPGMLIPYYWVRYSDITNALVQYDMTHRRKTFADNIWDNYFLSDVRPGVVAP